MIYRKDIDGLRALAILLVIGFHAFGVKGGFIGVDIFFVISGFLISTIIFDNIKNNQFSFLDFYVRRALRILPALITVLSFCIIFGWFALLGDEYQHLGKHVAGSSIFMSNLLLFKESGYFDKLSEGKILLHLWSLSIEEQFYIFWPLILLLVRRYIKKFFAFLMLAFIFSLTYCIYLTFYHPFSAFYSPLSRGWELITGAILSIALSSPHKKTMPFLATHSNKFSVIGFILIITATAILNKKSYFPGFWAMLPTFGTAFIILAGPTALLNRKILANNMMIFLGLISYPLYLWHWPLITFANILQGGNADLLILLYAVLISIFFAWLTYKFVEHPIRFRSNKKMTVPALITLLPAIGCLGWCIYLNNGFDSRLNDKVNKMNTLTASNMQSCFFITKAPPHDDWCYKGNFDTDNLNTILIGDSYSNSYSEMMVQYSKVNNLISFTQIGRGQCPALIDYGPEYCRKLSRKTLEFISKNKQIKNVMLALDWNAYINGKTYLDTNHREDTKNFKIAFKKTVKRYKAMGKNLVVFLSPPYGSKPKSCIPRPIRLSQKNICSLSLSTAEKNDQHYRDYLIPLLLKEKISYFDPFTFLCDNDSLQCKVALNNHIFYLEDGGHLSNHGGTYLAQQGKHILDKLLDDNN